MSGPLQGIRVVELAGIGPGPFAAMLLADLGADVVRVDRADQADIHACGPHSDVLRRGRRSVALDVKNPAGLALLLDLVDRADMLLEGFRPGVAERLGVGPDACLARRPSLVYGRMTGWGQDGPMARAAGHDLNYIALAGALAHIGRAGEAPVPPLNLVGDYGGGGMLLALGLVAAVVEAQRSGQGQVVDAAMVDGTALLMAGFWSMRAEGAFDPDGRGTNLLDGGAPFYDVYRCADDRYVSIAALEPQFFAELVGRLGLADAPEFASQHDRSTWPAMRATLTERFATRSRAAWCELLEGSDACFAPVLTMEEATAHPHMAARGTFSSVDGATQPSPAPRFSRTPATLSRPPAQSGADTVEALADWGVSADHIERAVSSGAAVQTTPHA